MENVKKKKNLQGEVEIGDTWLVDDFNGERLTRHGVFSELYFSEITLAKRPSKLVFPQSHSLPHLLLFRLLSHHPITGLEKFSKEAKKQRTKTN